MLWDGTYFYIISVKNNLKVSNLFRVTEEYEEKKVALT